MHLFLDTNILIDLLADRRPFSRWAIRIFTVAPSNNWTLYTSSWSILKAYYILEKELGLRKAKKSVRLLLDRLRVCQITGDQMRGALVLDFKDYEDAVQHECARRIEMVTYLVTRNKKDFSRGIVPAVRPEELFTT